MTKQVLQFGGITQCPLQRKYTLPLYPFLCSYCKTNASLRTMGISSFNLIVTMLEMKVLTTIEVKQHKGHTAN